MLSGDILNFENEPQPFQTMKKLAILAVAILFFAGCKDKPQPEPYQDYTSFVFLNATQIGTPPTFINCIAGYYKDGLCIKVADLGSIAPGKYSREIKVSDEKITSV